MARTVEKPLMRKGATALPGEHAASGWSWGHQIGDFIEHFAAGRLLSSRQWKTVVGIVLVMLLMVFWGDIKTRLLAWVDHDISRIEIRGQFNYIDRGALGHYLNRELGQSFLFTDLEAVKKGLLTLPWVYKGTVSRVWPGELLIHIEEQTPVAYWNDSGLLNPEGKIFRPQNIAENIAVPHFYGAASADQATTRKMLITFERLKQQMAVYGLTPVAIKYDPRGAWGISLQSGVEVMLGHDPLEKKVERIGRALSTEFAHRLKQIERVDARYPNGLAVSWKAEIPTEKNSKTK